MRPFGVEGTKPDRWARTRWWSQAPVLELPPHDTHLVVLAAHPDDETLGAGGLLHAASGQLDRVTIVVASDGAASHPDSTTHRPGDLARIRRGEVDAALRALAPQAELVQLDLPDGQLDEYHVAMVQALERVLDPCSDAWLLSTWIDDGHPDHAAAARAAREISGRRSRCRLFEYPIWFWHLGEPNDVPATFGRSVRRFELTRSDRAARASALAAYPSQTEPLSPHPGDGAVLSPEFLAHFERDRDFLIAVEPMPAAEPAYFDRLYSDSPDPWQLGSSWYEQRKRQLVLAALPRARFERCFEPGCARGDLSELLSSRVADLWCSDGSAAAVAAARERLPASVRVEQRRIPQQWPEQHFDLIVLSEIAYYVPDLDELSDRIATTLDDDGVLVLVHWRRSAPDHPHTAETVHATLRSTPGLSRLAQYRDEDFLIDVLARDPRSVAQRLGIH